MKIGVIGFSHYDEIPLNFRANFNADVSYGIGTMVSVHLPGTQFELVSDPQDIVTKYAVEYVSHKSKAKVFTKIVGSSSFLDGVDCLVKVGSTEKSDSEWGYFVGKYPTKPHFDLSAVYENS